MTPTLGTPLSMPTLRIELDGIKQAMLVAITDARDELHQAIKEQLMACLSTLTPEEIITSVRRAFNEALYTAVRDLGPELVQQAVTDFFTTGEGSQIVRDALRQKYDLGR